MIQVLQAPALGLETQPRQGHRPKPRQAGGGGAPSRGGDDSTSDYAYGRTGMSTKRQSYAEAASRIEISSDSGYSGRESSGESLGESSRKTTKKRSYAQAASHAPEVQRNRGIKQSQTQLPLQRPPNTPPTLKRARAVVMHGAPLRYKPGTMRQWIEEDNRGVEIMGIRGHLPGIVASSLVIYIKSAVEIGRLRMGRKTYNTERYDWGRGTFNTSKSRVKEWRYYLLYLSQAGANLGFEWGGFYVLFLFSGGYLVMYVDTGLERPGGGIILPSPHWEMLSLLMCHSI